MRVATTFKVEMQFEGEDPVTFTFRAPRLNELHKDQMLLKKLRSEKPEEVTDAQIELTHGIIEKCISAEGFIDENGAALGKDAILDLPISCLSALISAYHQGSAEAVKAKKPKAEPVDSASA